MLRRLGATPVAMTLGDVLPAIQQGTLDGAVAAMTIYTTMQYQDAAKYVTETGQPFIFSMSFLSKKWYDALPKTCRRSSTRTPMRPPSRPIPGRSRSLPSSARSGSEKGGELIELSPTEHGDDEDAVEHRR